MSDNLYDQMGIKGEWTHPGEVEGFGALVGEMDRLRTLIAELQTENVLRDLHFMTHVVIVGNSPSRIEGCTFEGGLEIYGTMEDYMAGKNKSLGKDVIITNCTAYHNDTRSEVERLREERDAYRAALAKCYPMKYYQDEGWLQCVICGAITSPYDDVAGVQNHEKDCLWKEEK